MTFQPQEFQKTLRQAIGDRSQSEFSRLSGVSKIQIYRMLNRPEVTGRPTIPTLMKIARNASNGVTFMDLLRSCNYSEEDLDFYTDKQRSARGEKGNRMLLSREDRVKACEKDILEGFRGLTSTPGDAIDSLPDYAEAFNLIYSVEDMSYDFGAERKKAEGDKHIGAYYTGINISWASEETEGEVYHLVLGILYYFKTDDGRYLVTAATFAVRDLIDCGLMEADTLPEDIYNKQILTISRERFQKKELDEKTMRRAEERLLAIIKDGEAQYPDLVCGLGFEVTKDIPNIAAFLEAHKKTFIHTPEDEETLAKVVSGEVSAWDAYEPYEDRYNYETGLPALLSMIMRKETSIPFSGWTEIEGEFCDNGADAALHSCVLLEEAYMVSDKYSWETVRELLFRYAKELGITEFGQQFHRTFQSFDYNEQYRITKKENGEYTYEQVPFGEMHKRHPQNSVPLAEDALERIERVENSLMSVTERLFFNDPNGIAIRNALDELSKVKAEITKAAEGVAVF